MGRIVDKPGIRPDKPQAEQAARVSSRKFLEARAIYPEVIRPGVLVSTYGTPAYVHLQLESLRRFAPGVPVLVFDDCSPEKDRLRELCEEYGASFEVSPIRYGHRRGDVAALVCALKWARGRCDLLAKFSRRFVWRADWLSPLLRRACGQYPTFGNRDEHYSLPVRTECYAVCVPQWCEVLPELEQAAFPDLVEKWLPEVIRKVPLPWQYAPPCCPDLFDSFPGLTDDRHRRTEEFLWHDAAAPEEYQLLAREWGLLDYKLSDFK